MKILTPTRRFSPVLVLVVSLLSFLILTMVLSRSVREAEEARISSRAEELVQALETRLSTYVMLLKGVAGHIGVGGEVPQRNELVSLLDNLRLHENHRGMTAVGVIQVVDGNPKSVHEFDLSGPGEAAAAALRDTAFRDALSRARDSGEPSASEKVISLQNVQQTKKPSFLIFVPTYKGGGIPKDTEERRNKIIGYVYGRFEGERLTRGIVGFNGDESVTVEIFDGLSVAKEYSLTAPVTASTTDTERLSIINVAGRLWTIAVSITPPTGIATGRFFITLVSIGGILISLLLFALVEAERRARARAEHSNEVKDKFVATLSHELRYPLHAIGCWTHLLKSKRDDGGSLEEGLEVIERNVRVQSEMVEELLDLSRIASGKLLLDKNLTSMRQAVDEVVALFTSLAQSKRQRIMTHAESVLPLVNADPRRLRQIVWNLVSNAVKFTPEGGEIHISLQRKDGMVELKVKDSGIGIARECLDVVFDEFSQCHCHGSVAKSSGGLGIGLTIVRSLAELHQGEVQVESEGLGKGATFTLLLPASSVAKEEGGVALERVRTELHDQLLKDMRILLVDDEEDSLAAVRRLLEQQGASVTCATSAHDAITQMRNGEFHVIVSDLSMPVIDGYQMLEIIRSLHSPGRRVPAIALTAYDAAEDRVRAQEAGYIAHLSKPLEPRALFDVVAKHVPIQ